MEYAGVAGCATTPGCVIAKMNVARNKGFIRWAPHKQTGAYYRSTPNELKRLAGRTYEVAQHGHVRTIRADAPCIHGQPETLGEIQVHAGIIQFRKAEACRRQYAIHSGGIDRPRRAVALPRAASQLIKLLPIAFVPL